MGSQSPPSLATTGLAEGDPLAVAAMIMVGFLWVKLLERLGVATSVFADDWQWFGSSVETHIAVLQETQRLLSALKLHSDPRKCWVWGTTSQARKDWSRIALAVTGNPRSYRLCFAERELGVQLHLSRQLTLGFLKGRFDSAMSRLRKLRFLPLSLLDKMSKVQTNILPLAFWGVELVYLGKRHFAGFRTQIVDSTMVKTPATNPIVACSALSDVMLDPFLYVLLRALSMWRRLFLTDRASFDLCKHVLIQASDDAAHAYGPAGALRTYCSILGWYFDEHGNLFDHLHCPIDLFMNTMSQITTRVREAWDCHVQTAIHRHKEFNGWPEPLTQSTCGLLKPFDRRDQASLAIYISMGSLFKTQQAKWHLSSVQNDAALCPICKNCEDSRLHLLTQCPGTLDLREEYCELICDVASRCPPMLSLPLMYKHPMHHFLRSSLCKLPLPPVIELSQDLPFDVPSVPVCYTDGSCINPHLAPARLSSYAIVISCHSQPVDMATEADSFWQSDELPGSLVPWQVGLVPGEQTINRAELLAIIQCVRTFDAAYVLTDSLYAFHLVLEVIHYPYIEAFLDRPNLDLIQVLCNAFQAKDPTQFHLIKIPAHRNNHEASDAFDLYNLLGNRAADMAAKSALRSSCSSLHQCAHEVCEHYSWQWRTLHRYAGFLAKLDQLRMQALDQLVKEDASSERVSVEYLLEWAPLSPWRGVVVDKLDDDMCRAFLPGAGLVRALVQWAATLQWPTCFREGDPGISQYELIVHFVSTTGISLSKLASRKKGYPVFADPQRDPETSVLPACGADSVRLLQMAIRHVHSLTGIQLFPIEFLARRPFLKWFGFRSLLSGYIVRPVLPFQLNHLQIFPDYISSTGMAFPEPKGQVQDGTICRDEFDSDFWSHEDRAKWSNRFFQRWWYVERQRGV